MKKKQSIDSERSVIDEKLRSALEETEIPESLSPENLPTLIENRKPTEKSNVITNLHFYRLSFAVLLIIVMVIPLYAVLESKDSDSTSPDYTGTGSLSTIITTKNNDYDSIYNVVQNLYSKLNSYSAGDFHFSSQLVQSDIMGTGDSLNEPTGTQSSPVNSSEDKNQHSTTNEQVEGVNEGDILKTDGKYLYTLQAKKNKDDTDDEYFIHIRKIQEDGGLMKVSSFSIEQDRPIEMYVDNNRLIMVSSSRSAYNERYSSQNTSVRIYDISNRTVPKIINHFYQQGNILSSRYIDGNLYLISRFYSGVQPIKDDLFSYVPTITYPSKGQIKMVASNDICVMENPTSFSYVIASSVSTRAEDAEVNTKAVLGSGSTIYCSTENLYVFGSFYGNSEQTEILKFTLNNGKIRYSAKQTVSGRTLNQFSADEYEGYFRIATTDFDAKTGQNINRLYLFDDTLKQVGSINGFAAGESIYAVRFSGEVGYVITFRQTDPLFILNLKDPTKPQIEGQLKIPGFSSYLHPFKENLLIGVGANTSSDGRRIGCKLSLFDVSDPTTPAEIAKFTTVDDTDGITLVEYDAKAFLFDDEQDIIGIPLITDGKNGYALFKVSAEKGFEQLCFLDAQGNPISENSVSQSTQYIVPSSMNGIYSQFDILRGAYVEDTLYLYTGYDITALNYKTIQKIGSYPCDR